MPVQSMDGQKGGRGGWPIISGILNQVYIQVGAVVHFCADMESLRCWDSAPGLAKH